jgi:hypothetical protein
MSKEIIFSKVLDVSDEFFPKPASSFLPDWYKKTESFRDNKKDIFMDGSPNATMKKCLPVFDVLTAGYIITTPTDLWIKNNEQGQPVYITSNKDLPIEMHSIIQSPYHPFMNNAPYPKWLNPWGIKTPKGYSCLFLPPVHGGNEYFQILEGFVDTDTYNAPINFPFILKDIKFEGLIPAGTPMVQVIPVKRDQWKIKKGSAKDIDNSIKIQKSLNARFYDRYRNFFWNRKSYT